MDAQHVDLSIIVVSWNVKELLRQCLKSIYENVQRTKFEIFVVDNDSGDDSVGMVRKEFPEVKLVANSENVGFAKANNQAIRASNSKYYLLLNPDTVVIGDAIDQMVEFMEQNPEYGMLGPKLVKPNMQQIDLGCARKPMSLLTELFRITLLSSKFPRCWPFGMAFFGYWDHNSNRDIEVISGACMLVRRAATDQIGLLDEKFFIYAEDIDWCCRMWKGGWKICFLASPQIIHYGGQSTTDVPSKREFDPHKLFFLLQDYSAREKFFRKNYGPGHAFIYKRMILLGMLGWDLLWRIRAQFHRGERLTEIHNILYRNRSIIQWASGKPPEAIVELWNAT